ncbi:MAG: serine hydrolase domain-containing protein [Cyclonatronaceae bacterium]
MNLIAALIFIAFSLPGSVDANSINSELQIRFERHHSPGALVVWVKDGQVVTNSGFGYANLDEQRPVDPARTLVRVGSISKPFTGIGILNSIEAGELDLRTDINTWFDPDTDALKDLLTGYFENGGQLEPLGYNYILDAPAGQLVTTGDDMARFMLLMLEPGGLQNAGVLSAGMTQRMIQSRFTHHPELNGAYGYLWSISEYGGHQVIGHSGGYLGVAARLLFSRSIMPPSSWQ